MRNFVEIDGRRLDTASREWLLICLARHICRMPTEDKRKAFLAALKWSEEAVDELKQITRTEWKRMYPKRQKQGVAAHDNA